MINQDEWELRCAIDPFQVAKGISHIYSLETNDNGTSTINEDVFAIENGPTSTLLLLLLFPASSAAA